MIEGGQGEKWEEESGKDTKQCWSMNWSQRMLGVGGLEGSVSAVLYIEILEED